MTTVRPVNDGRDEPAIRFLADWVVDGGEDGARAYLAGHTAPEGARAVTRPVTPPSCGSRTTPGSGAVASPCCTRSWWPNRSAARASPPSSWTYAQRGYVPDGRGACRGQQPLREGTEVTMDHDLILWLSKDL